MGIFRSFSATTSLLQLVCLATQAVEDIAGAKHAILLLADAEKDDLFSTNFDWISCNRNEQIKQVRVCQRSGSLGQIFQLNKPVLLVNQHSEEMVTLKHDTEMKKLCRMFDISEID